MNTFHQKAQHLWANQGDREWFNSGKQSNIVCFRFVGDGTHPDTFNSLNAGIRQKLLEEGNFYIVQTTLREKLYLRVSLMNPLTQKEDLTALLTEIEEIAARIG